MTRGERLNIMFVLITSQVTQILMVAVNPPLLAA
jgi:hypothetical protein